MIPMEGVEFESYPLSRFPRQVENPEGEVSTFKPQRDEPILDFVDFGSQTGANGAYSWYADFPAQV